ncbi:MAG: pilus assembly protein [Pirellulales bacterium]|nr:pilus assembly protein [Pirellulales bacterium]
MTQFPLIRFGQNASPSQGKLEKVCQSCRKNRGGAAAVEFAVVAPVFFLLVFGMIEFGRMVMVQQIITNASREGARLAVLDSPTPIHDEVVSKVTTYLDDAGIHGADVSLDPNEPTTGAAYGDPVTVTVTIPFSQVSWLPTPFFLGERNLVATTVMRRETVQ